MFYCPFQEYFTYIEPVVNQKWAKTGVPGEKPPDILLQNLASHMCLEQGLNHSGEMRDPMLRVNVFNHRTTEASFSSVFSMETCNDFIQL